MFNISKSSFSFRRLNLLALAAIAVASVLVVSSGCSTQNKLASLQSEQEFDQRVLRSDKPVLVDFYKNNCPTCVLQEAALEPLTDEYAGRVEFYRFKIREATMASAAPAIMDRYNLFWVPTVILFVDGKEHKRWTFNHGTGEFRKALDAVLAGKPAAQASDASVKELGNWSLTAPAAGDGCIGGKGCPIRRPAGK